jgi:hypothetical protein
VRQSKAHSAAISKGKSKYNIPFNKRTHHAEYQKAYRAAKQAEKLAGAAKGKASVQSVFKKLKEVGGARSTALRSTVLGNALMLGMTCPVCRPDNRPRSAWYTPCANV